MKERDQEEFEHSLLLHSIKCQSVCKFEIEHVDEDRIMAVILTELPKEFPLNTGSSIDVFEEEILYRNKVDGVVKILHPLRCC